MNSNRPLYPALAGQVAFVSGGASGIGEAIVEAFWEQGAHVAFCDLDEQAGHALCERLGNAATGTEPVARQRPWFARCDVRDIEAYLNVLDAAASALGPIRTLVNNAGLGTYRRFGTAPLEAELGMLDLNVRAVLALSHAAVAPMVARGAGLILNVSSVAGYAPRPNNATYAASKAWVTLFSEALALQLEGTGVHVCAICPGFTRTEFHQRAGADMSAVPAWMWLAADDVVRAGLRDAERGRSISVPSARYKLLVGLARYLPRPVLRAAMRRGY